MMGSISARSGCSGIFNHSLSVQKDVRCGAGLRGVIKNVG